MSEHPFSQFVRILGRGKKAARSLTYDESLAAMQMILNGKVEDVQLGAFLMLLRIKEESYEELAGFTQAARNIIPQTSTALADLDWPSYAGKRENLHHYILSMILLSESGLSILCHGAKGHTANRIYTEDVFLELGLSVANDFEHAKKLIDSQNLTYLPLNNFSSELHNIINLRDLFGLRSPVHSFAKLINPGNCPFMLVPIFHPSYKPVHQQAGILLNEKNMAIFKGESGEAERRPQAILSVDRIEDGITACHKWNALLDSKSYKNHEQKQTPDISKLLAIWRGTENNDYAEKAIVGTCALALHLCKKADSPEKALTLANELWESRNKKLL
jgi:anthranilate phosphoribosyltransferase